MTPERLIETDLSKETIQITGRILYLTRDPELIRAQIEGKEIKVTPENLRDKISTDEIIPSWAGMLNSTPEHLGKFLLTGIPQIQPDSLINGKFEVIVAGKSFGRGSSREHVQLALNGAGIKLVAAESFERIFKENCNNYGIFTIKNNTDCYQRIINKKPVTVSELTQPENIITKQIIEAGGLLPFTKKRLEGKVNLPEVKTGNRPMTIAEKIIAKHTKTKNGIGVDFVKPGDILFSEIDLGYAYELQSVISKQVLEQTFPNNAPVKPTKFYLFEDHLALMEPSDFASQKHRLQQREFAEKYKLKLYDVTNEGVEGICHTVMVEKHILPGQLVLGNDSHTCTGGAVNALAIGKGASEFAAALLTEDIPLVVPESIRFNLHGVLKKGVTAKDLMLHILSMPELKEDLIGSNRVFEFGGEALDLMPFDYQVVLANMSIEGQGFTGIVEPNRKLIEYIATTRGINREEIERKLTYPDKNAEYKAIFDIDLDKVERMVALPGDTQNGIKLSELGYVPIKFAYIGSCTGGNFKDLAEAANVLYGKRVSKNVHLRVQASSLSIYRKAEKEGIWQIFKEAGAEIVLPGCGDCMGATKEALENEEDVISNTNRNFPGRMGKKRNVYLANSQVVAASAILGRIGMPEEID